MSLDVRPFEPAAHLHGAAEDRVFLHILRLQELWKTGQRRKKTVRLYAAARACRWATVVLIPDLALRLLVTNVFPGSGVKTWLWERAEPSNIALRRCNTARPKPTVTPP